MLWIQRLTSDEKKRVISSFACEAHVFNFSRHATKRSVSSNVRHIRYTLQHTGANARVQLQHVHTAIGTPGRGGHHPIHAISSVSHVNDSATFVGLSTIGGCQLSGTSARRRCNVCGMVCDGMRATLYMKCAFHLLSLITIGGVFSGGGCPTGEGNCWRRSGTFSSEG